MKFAQVVLGTRAEKEIELPIAGSDTPLRFALRPLTGAEEIEVIARATAAAQAKGLPSPTDGHPLYDIALWAHTLAVSAVDLDSPKDARTPFFDGGADQILAHLHPETIALLHERQQIWQDECSPTRRAKSAGELLQLARKLAAEDADDRPFVEAPPLTRWHLLRFMARLLRDSLGARWPSSSPSSSPSDAAPSP